MIKADTCDLRSGLMESVRGIWSGDVDLGDGAVDKHYSSYQSECSIVKKLGSETNLTLTLPSLRQLIKKWEDDIEFLETGLKDAKLKYKVALTAAHKSDQNLMKLAWDVIGFEELIKCASNFKIEIGEVIENVKLDLMVLVKKTLNDLKPKILKYYKDIYPMRREEATHLMVFMIADELRNRKPYAIPVWFLSYHSITDQKMRELDIQLEKHMKSIGMIPVGKFTYKMSVHTFVTPTLYPRSSPCMHSLAKDHGYEVGSGLKCLIKKCLAFCCLGTKLRSISTFLH